MQKQLKHIHFSKSALIFDILIEIQYFDNKFYCEYINFLIIVLYNSIFNEYE